MRMLVLTFLLTAFLAPSAHAAATFEITESQVVSGSIGPNEVAGFQFSLDRRGFLSANTFGSDFDTVLTLLRVTTLFDDLKTVSFVAENDDSFGFQSEMFRRLQAGDYALVVSGFANFFPFGGDFFGSSFGDFTLSYDVAEFSIVPVPAAAPLLVSALGGLLWLRRRRA